MNDRLKQFLILGFTIVYVVFFTIFGLIRKDYAFLYNTVIIVFVGCLIFAFKNNVVLKNNSLFGLSLLGFFHFFGGNIYFNSIRIYDTWFFNGLFRYDNFMHLFGIFIVALICYDLILPSLKKKTEKHHFYFGLIIILISVGVGAFNEIIELIAVIFFGAAEQIGDYMNNALDILYNFIGAILATIFIFWHEKKYKQIK